MRLPWMTPTAIPALAAGLGLAAVSGCSPSAPQQPLPPPFEPHFDSQRMAQTVQAELAREQTRAPLPASPSIRELNHAWLRRVGAPLVEEASERERELSRAVVRICSAHEDQCGTGFFISPDGLLLTNEHVVPATHCSLERCGGFNVVRDATVGGAN